MNKSNFDLKAFSFAILAVLLWKAGAHVGVLRPEAEGVGLAIQLVATCSASIAIKMSMLHALAIHKVLAIQDEMAKKSKG